MDSSLAIRALTTEHHAAAFNRLNRAWIAEHFTLTDEDERVLSQPRGAIIQPGGAVLIAETDEGSVLGTVALIAHGDRVFELAKMTVDASA